MWKIELEEAYFKIYDSQKNIAGYFDPDYGELFPKEKELEIIEQMHKNHDKISGGFLMVPMLKFTIFDNDNELRIDELEKKLELVNKRIFLWKEFLNQAKNRFHAIRVSHTDQDMLTMTFPIKFESPVPLEKKLILENLQSILNQLQKLYLL